MGDEKQKRSIKDFLPIVIGIAVFIGIVGGGFFYLKKKNQNLKLFKVASITYKRIYFDKFVIAKNIFTATDKNGISKYFSKAWVFYVKGFVDVEFPLKDFRLVNGDTLVYEGEFKYGGEVLPYQLTITIPAEDFYDVYEIEPQRISKKTAERIGKVVGAVVAPLGGYLGAKVGGSIGSVVCRFIPNALKIRAICGTVGAIAGGLAGGAGRYLSVSHFTRKLIEGFRFADKLTVEDKHRLLEEAKKLILLDIASNPDLQKEFKEAFENYVKSYFSQYGIKINKIVYKTSG